ncbi:MAG: DUF4105 domain-containing protein [Pseudomonadota bacterium]
MIRAVLFALLAALGVFALTVVTKQPRDHRDWQPHLAKTASVTETAKGWTVSPVRDWTYTEDGVSSKDWLAEAVIVPDQLQQVWLVLEPHPGYPMMAHTLVLFEFTGGELIGLTIEARKETDERFAPVRGALNRFELVYVWATPRDLLTRRAVMLGHELELYPLALTPAQETAFLTSVVTRTQALSEAPRFYNTLTSNCTSELAKAAELTWDPAFILTGGAAEALWEIGVIEGTTFEAARQRAIVTDPVIDGADLPRDAFNTGMLSSARQRAMP